ncbi:MAG: protein kinase [Gemmataceae bacterium]|nr:protein kinase [Gemmataceae bacterium]
MAEPLDCPALTQWQTLLAGEPTPEERQRYERHLDSCPVCQERLDDVDDGHAGADPLLRLARASGDPTAAPADATLIQVMKRLHETKSPLRAGGAPDLYFLQSSARTDILGTLGAYEILEVIGQGGMGVVLKAFDPALHRLVAIKVMAAAVAGSPNARRRFQREAQAAAAVCHDHILTVHGVVDDAGGLPYLVMQYVAGESLQDRLDRTGPLEPIEIVRIGLQTASGLAAAHAQGLIHRDIKPANILLENGLARVRITDFGLARMVDADVQLTQQGAVHGTPEYMAPEQARGETVDHRADLFSLGSVLYAMCTGCPPFPGSSTVAVLRHVSDQAPAPIRSLNPNVPVWLEALVARLMAKNPAERFQSAAEVAALLEGYLAHLREPATTHAPHLPAAPLGSVMPRAIRDFLARWRRVGLLAACVVLTAAGLGTGLWWGGARGTPTTTTQDTMQEFYQSFKAGADGLPIVERTGPDADACVRFESDGVRISLPAGYAGEPGFSGERPDTGIIVPIGVRGDFEITVHFEILQEPAPDHAGIPQTRFSLDAGADRGRNVVTMLSRRVEKLGGTQFTAWVSRWNEDNGANDRDYQEFPSFSKKAALRMVRKGDAVWYYASDHPDHPDQPFALLRSYPFSADMLEDVRLTASTGNSPEAALDVRVTDVRIRADSLILPDSGATDDDVKLWVAVALAVALAVGLTLAVVRGRRARNAAAPAPTLDPPPAPAVPQVFFACSGCAKKLRARASLAGKNVKCPRCGQSTPVPEAGA